MAGTEILWRTKRGDTCGVTVLSPDASAPDHVRVLVGLPSITLRLPIAQARALAQALTDAAAEFTLAAPAPRTVIPIRRAPPALYHEPEDKEESCPNLPAA